MPRYSDEWYQTRDGIWCRYQWVRGSVGICLCKHCDLFYKSGFFCTVCYGELTQVFISPGIEPTILRYGPELPSELAGD